MDKHPIKKLYTNYESFLADPLIDIVYIGIPNSLHFEYSIAALMANVITSYSIHYTKLYDPSD